MATGIKFKLEKVKHIFVAILFLNGNAISYEIYDLYLQQLYTTISDFYTAQGLQRHKTFSTHSHAMMLYMLELMRKLNWSQNVSLSYAL